MDTPDDTFSQDRGLLTHTPTPPMRLASQPGPYNAHTTRQSQVYLVQTGKLDGEVGKIMSPASPGLAQPQHQETPDPHPRDNKAAVAVATATPDAAELPLQLHIPIT